MAKLKVSGGSVNVPALFLGGIIEAGDLIDQVNTIFRMNGELLQSDQDAFLARPLTEIYKAVGIIFEIAEVSCRMNDIDFEAKEWLNKKTKPQDINAIYMFFFDLMSESGFGAASGEVQAEGSTPPSSEEKTTAKRTPRKTK